LKWEGIGAKNLFPHTSSYRHHDAGAGIQQLVGGGDW